MHHECEAVLLEDKSLQKDVGGAGWYPARQETTFDSYINIRPNQNRSLYVEDENIKQQIKIITERLLGGVQP